MVVAIALVLLVLGASAGAVLLGARRLALRAGRARAEAIEPRSTYPTVAVVRARHLSTHLAGTRLALSLQAFPPGAEGELGVTDREVVLSSGFDTLLYVPLERVSEAALVGAFGDVVAGDHTQLLRVSWTAGGEAVASVFEIAARRHDAERVRREAHLRAGRAGRIWQPPEPPAGSA